MAAPLIENVSDTAFWVAHHRALEGERADALFRDPLAGVLAGDHGRLIAGTMPQPAMTTWAVVIRTCIIDDFIREAIAQGADTILNLGAGLDTRPYRMELPASLTWIEADYPGMIAFKESRLADEAPRCKLTRLRLDLADASARRQMLAGVEASAKKMLVLTEGVIPYLTEEDVGALADDLRALKSARWWVVDCFSPRVLRMRARRVKHKMQNAPFKFTPGDWTGFFKAHGWRCAEMRYLAEESERLKREMPLPLIAKAYLSVRQLFLPRERREAYRKFAGYALLEPR
ncbi:MAG: class I SAM-dependent methyltransferase [Hyphomicrobium sp.]